MVCPCTLSYSRIQRRSLMHIKMSPFKRIWPLLSDVVCPSLWCSRGGPWHAGEGFTSTSYISVLPTRPCNKERCETNRLIHNNTWDSETYITIYLLLHYPRVKSVCNFIFLYVIRKDIKSIFINIIGYEGKMIMRWKWNCKDYTRRIQIWVRTRYQLEQRGSWFEVWI